MRTRLFVVVLMLAGLMSAPFASSTVHAATCRSLQAVKLSTSTIVGGRSLTGTVVMACRIHRSATVRLAAFPGVRVPDSVTVPAGSRTASFTIRTATTSVVREGKVKATFRTVRRSAALKVRPTCMPRVYELVLPTNLHAGESAPGRVTLNCAPAAATSVALSSDHPNVAVPASVSVAAGKRSATFSVATASTYSSSYVANLKAQRGTSALTRALTVTPGLKAVAIPPSNQPNDVNVNVAFTGPLASGGATVSLSSSSPAVTVPPTAGFQEGSVGGSVPGIEVHEVTQETPVTITLTYGRRTLTATKTLVPPADPTAPTGRLSCQCEGEFRYGGEYWVQYDLHLDAPAPAGGLSVTWRIRDADPTVALESTSGHIIEGFTSDSTFLSFQTVTSAHTVVLEAVIGETVLELPITIQPAVTEIVVPDTVVGGQSFTGTVSLAGPASVDTVVHLFPSWSIVDAQYSVTIPAGQTSATFEATTSVVTEESRVFISGSYGGPEVQSNIVTLTP